MDGNATGTLDGSIEAPEVVRLRREDGELISESGVIAVDGSDGRFEIFVRMPSDCAVIVDARLESVEPA